MRVSESSTQGIERIEKTVFISYRRTNIPWALAIFQNLTQHGYDVFFDYNGVGGDDFERIILGNIAARAHFLVLLTPSALERCGDPGDWLRREIETALDGNRNIVPLMLEGFDFGTPGIANQLTGTLAPLKQFNGLGIPPEYFLEAMDRLRIRYLNLPLTAVLHPASAPAQQAAVEQKAAAEAAPAVTTEDLNAQQYFERGFDAATLNEKLRFYTQAVRLKPDYAAAFNNRGVVLMAKTDLEGALQDYDEAIRLRAEAGAFNNRGIARGHKGDLVGALQDYNEAIRLKPDYPDALNNRGNVRRAVGDLVGALQDYDQAIDFKRDAVAFNNRGIARGQNGDLEGALQDFDQAIGLKLDYADAFNNRGNVRKARGDVFGALQDYDETIRLKPDPLAFHNRGIARSDRGDLEGALQDFNEAIRLKPDYALAFLSRARARHVQGDPRGALQDYDEAIRLKPQDALAFYNRASALREKGDLVGALEDYNEAIRLKADYAEALYNRALLWKEHAHHSEAIADFQRYLDVGGGERDGDTEEVEGMISDLKKELSRDTA